MGLEPIFFSLEYGLRLNFLGDIETLVEKLVVQLGYELVDFEIVNGGQLLRIYIDNNDLVSIEDCTTVSNHVNNVLSVETDYDYERLEVSSPGLDRVIKKLKDFERFKGEQAEEKLLAIDFENIDKARLDPNY